MIEVYKAASVIDAQLLCDQLIDDGMNAVVRGGYLSGAAGEIPVDSIVSVWLCEDSHFERARALVARFESHASTTGSPCFCAKCGESTTSDFTHCWNCESPIGEDQFND